MKLVEKHVLIKSKCFICQKVDEDTAHALIQCLSVQNFWLPYLLLVHEFWPGMNFMEMTLQVNEETKLESLKMFFMLGWSFWHKRNKRIHESKLREPQVSIAHALSLYKGFKVTMSKSTQLRHFGYWTRPPEGYIRLNVDRTMFFY